MAGKPDEKGSVTVEELLMANMIQMDALTQLLIEKGVFKEDEFFTKLEQVGSEYQKEDNFGLADLDD